jgi:hypothetical protein
VSERGVAVLPARAVEALGPLRRVHGLLVLADGDTIWLRWEGDATLRRRLLVLPDARVFDLLPDGQLVPDGRRVPSGRLPDGVWMTLLRWLEVTTEPAALPGQVRERVPVRVVPSGAEREANVLLTDLQAWVEYASSAPQVRLSRCRFAASGAAVVVIGSPLPPLPGTRFCERDGIAVQAGHAWEPALDAAVLRAALRLENGDLALLHADGSCDRIRGSEFVAASRSAVRFSAGGAADE